MKRFILRKTPYTQPIFKPSKNFRKYRYAIIDPVTQAILNVHDSNKDYVAAFVIQVPDGPTITPFYFERYSGIGKSYSSEWKEQGVNGIAYLERAGADLDDAAAQVPQGFREGHVNLLAEFERYERRLMGSNDPAPVDEVIALRDGYYARVDGDLYGPWTMKAYAEAGLKTEQRRAKARKDFGPLCTNCHRSCVPVEGTICDACEYMNIPVKSMVEEYDLSEQYQQQFIEIVNVLYDPVLGSSARFYVKAYPKLSSMFTFLTAPQYGRPAGTGYFYFSRLTDRGLKLLAELSAARPNDPIMDEICGRVG